MLKRFHTTIKELFGISHEFDIPDRMCVPNIENVRLKDTNYNTDPVS